MTTFTGIALIDQLLAAATPRVNDRGNEVRSIFLDAERYLFDFQLDSSAWEQFDTTSDASYFGIWLSKAALCTLSYVEGDIYFVCIASVEKRLLTAPKYGARRSPHEQPQTSPQFHP